MSDYYIGLMSGTSVDGIDAVLADFSADRPVLLAAQTIDWPPALRARILDALQQPHAITLPTFGQLDAELGQAFAHAALQIVRAAALQPGQINAIGSHGQTLLHAPAAAAPFTVQAGDAHRIAAMTGITTVADFRRRDMVAGGQGAPLAPAFHQVMFSRAGVSRAILNIGGIANVTLLPGDTSPATGFDTGPGNVLLDAWINRQRQLRFDGDGAWAEQGRCCQPLLEHLLQTPYLQQTPPKSTGRELFRSAWLDQVMSPDFINLAAVDVQATLAEFTVASIVDALHRFGGAIEELYVCGGGAHNRLLMQRLRSSLPTCPVASTEALGLHPDWVEATAFAWLARQALAGEPGNLPSVTGASRATVLGAIFPA